MRASASMTPKLSPLPPCTATPAGLLITIRSRSSKITADPTNSRSDLDGAARLWLLFALQRGQPHPIAGAQAMLRFRPTAVHAHLTRAQDPVDQTARNVLQYTREEVVDALSIVAGGCLDIANACSDYGCVWISKRRSGMQSSTQKRT